MGIIRYDMTIGALRLKIRTLERASIPRESAAARREAVCVFGEVPTSAPEYSAPEYDEDGRLYAFRFPRSTPERVVIDRDRLFEYARRRRPTADGGPIRLLPDIEVRRFVRDLKNSADFFTGVRELQTHPDVELATARRESSLVRLRR